MPNLPADVVAGSHDAQGFLVVTQALVARLRQPSAEPVTTQAIRDNFLLSRAANRQLFASHWFDPYRCVCYGSFARQNLSRGEEIISGLALVLLASPLTLLEQTSGLARVVLGILLVLSVFSWAMILQKWAQLGGMDRKTNRFLQMFRAGGGLPNPKALRAGSSGTPLMAVYDAGYAELSSQLDGAQSARRPGEKRQRHRRGNARGGGRRSAAARERNVHARDHRFRFAVHRTYSARCGA